MKLGDRLLQYARIRQALRWIPANASVLDIGSGDGTLSDFLDTPTRYVGVDPDPGQYSANIRKGVRRGLFPAALEPTDSGFDVVVLLAVMEHIPMPAQPDFLEHIRRVTVPGARVIVSVPHPMVDRILEVLIRIRAIDGMEADEHFGFDPGSLPGTFAAAGFDLVARKRFQLGLNNLFVFSRKQ